MKTIDVNYTPIQLKFPVDMERIIKINTGQKNTTSAKIAQAVHTRRNATRAKGTVLSESTKS